MSTSKLNEKAAQYADTIWVRALHKEKWQWCMKDWRNGYFTGRQDTLDEVTKALGISRDYIVAAMNELQKL